MKIIKSKHIGFCSGVKRCISLVEKVLKTYPDKEIYAIGDLLHNEQEMSRLKSLGLRCISDATEVKRINKNSYFFIPTHGIEKNFLDDFINSGVNFIDGTCPIVKNVQKIVNTYSNKGYNLIIYGDINHPEIKSLKSYINPTIKKFIINSIDQINTISLDTNSQVVVVAQTTKELNEYIKITDVLKKTFHKIKVFTTICRETILRETETADIAKKVDLVIVIGGKNSANTKKLAKIASEYKKTLCINSPEDSSLQEVKLYNSIGIISGASTPLWLIEDVIKKIYFFTGEKNEKRQNG